MIESSLVDLSVEEAQDFSLAGTEDTDLTVAGFSRWTDTLSEGAVVVIKVLVETGMHWGTLGVAADTAVIVSVEGFAVVTSAGETDVAMDEVAGVTGEAGVTGAAELRGVVPEVVVVVAAGRGVDTQVAVDVVGAGGSAEDRLAAASFLSSALISGGGRVSMSQSDSRIFLHCES